MLYTRVVDRHVQYFYLCRRCGQEHMTDPRRVGRSMLCKDCRSVLTKEEQEAWAA